MKRAIALLVLTMTMAVTLARAEVVERVVAVVGDEIILLSELDSTLDVLARLNRQAIEAQAAQITDPGEREQWIRRQLAGQAPQVLDEMIRERLILAQAKKFGISVGEAEVEAQIDAFAQQRGMGREALGAAIAEQGYDWESYRKELERQILRVKVERRAMAGKVTLTEEDERAYYALHYAGEGPAEARLRILFLAAEQGSAERQKMGRKSRKLLGRIRGGAAFADLARENTQGPNAAGGGDVGFLAKGQMLPAVEEAAFVLPVGGVSEVIETERGFFLIQVVDRRGGEPPPFEEVQPEIRKTLLNERAEQAFGAWLEEIERNTHIERRL